jgi:hypothetical protein
MALAAYIRFEKVVPEASIHHVHGLKTYIRHEKSWSKDYRDGMYMARRDSIRNKNVVPENSPSVCTWTEQPISAMKKVGPVTSPSACTWPEQPISATKKVGPETSPTACNWPEQPISATKKVGPSS